MQYDFTSILDRKGKDAIAVDAPDMKSGFGADYFAKAKLKPGFDRIPMWVADMNFPTVPTIPEAIIERVKHPAYGYFVPRDEYYEEIMQWHEKRNRVTGLNSTYSAPKGTPYSSTRPHISDLPEPLLTMVTT